MYYEIQYVLLVHEVIIASMIDKESDPTGRCTW